MDKKQLKQFKSTFHFGASVRYEKILVRGYGEDEFGKSGWNKKVRKVWKQKQGSTRTGIVVGWRWLSNGTSSYDSEDGYCYTATESVFAIEVKRGMMNKVDLVLPEELTIIPSICYFIVEHKGVLKRPALPTIPDRIPTVSEKDKQRLSNEMKSVPRDSKGKWI